MVSNSAYLMTGDNLEYLIRLLNSRIIEGIYKLYYATTLGTSGVRWLAQNIINLPIPQFVDDEIQHQIVQQENDDAVESLVSSIYKLDKDEISYLIVRYD